MLWLGSQQSYNAYRDAVSQIDAATLSGMVVPETGPGYMAYGNVAVVDVFGALTNRDSFYNSLFGVLSYGQIRECMVNAATDPDVEELILNFDTPGGAVSGCFDTAQLIGDLGRHFPITTFVSGVMGSAGLLLGCMAGKVYATPMSVVGSLGVVRTVYDRTKMLKKDGIVTHILRSGEKKALGGPDEALTAEAEKELQMHVDDLCEVFIETVAQARGLSVDFVQKNLASGREFVGDKAQEVGLIDGMTTLSSLVGGIQAKIDSKSAGRPRRSAHQVSPQALSTPTASQPSFPKDLSMKNKRQLLTEKAIALLSAGVPMATVLQGEGTVMDPAPAEPVVGTPPVSGGPTPAEPPVSGGPTPAEPPVSGGPTPAEPPVSGGPTPAPTTPPPAPDLVGYLQQELAAKSAELTQTSVKIADLERELTGYQATHAGMIKVVANHLSLMHIGLYGRAPDLSALSEEALLTLHSQTSADFNKQYPVGGIANSGSTAPGSVMEAPEAHKESSMARGRLRAVKP